MLQSFLYLVGIKSVGKSGMVHVRQMVVGVNAIQVKGLESRKDFDLVKVLKNLAKAEVKLPGVQNVLAVVPISKSRVTLTLLSAGNFLKGLGKFYLGGGYLRGIFNWCRCNS